MRGEAKYLQPHVTVAMLLLSKVVRPEEGLGWMVRCGQVTLKFKCKFIVYRYRHPGGLDL